MVRTSKGWLVTIFVLFFTGSAYADNRGEHDRHHDDFFAWADFSRIIIGYQISPVPLDVRGKDALAVGLGSYLVNAVGTCNNCHTSPSFAPGGDPFKGEPPIVNSAVYMAGGRRFGTVTISANLTPDDRGLPAGLTFREFLGAIRTGRDPHEPERILQVMPWPVFRSMSERDLRAIYEFLRAIPSRTPATP